MYTEEEAKTKWCPFVQFHGDPVQGGGDNRPSGEEFAQGSCKCISSACMSWRWAPEPNPAYVPMGPTWPDTRTENQKYMMLPGSTRGYCGLAGKP